MARLIWAIRFLAPAVMAIVGMYFLLSSIILGKLWLLMLGLFILIIAIILYRMAARSGPVNGSQQY